MAAKLVEAKGLIDNLDEFDELYNLSNIPFETHRKYIMIGDWRKIKSTIDYLDTHPNGEWSNENVIYVSPIGSIYWGWDKGDKSESEWLQLLRIKSGATRMNPIVGWELGATQFLDVAKISMDAFDLRNREIATLR